MTALKKLFSPYRELPKEIYVIFISRVINAMGCFVMPLLTIILTEKVGLSSETAGLYLSLAGVVFLPASLLGGKLADTVGRKKIIIIFDTLAAIFYIICGFVKPSMTIGYLILVAGACMAIATPGHDSLMADLTNPKNRSGAYSLSYMGHNLGFAVGPVIGGILYKNHLPLVFIGDAATALIALALVAFMIKETIHKTKEKITDESRALERQVEGSIFSVLLKRPILIYIAIIVFIYNFAYAQWSFMLPMQLMGFFKDDGAKFFGMVAGLNGLTVVLFTPVITKVAENVKHIRRMVYGGLLYALGLGLFSFVTTMPMFFLGAYIFTLGEIINAISLTPFIANHTPASHRGRMSSVIPILWGMGHTLSPLVMGKVLMHTTVQRGWMMLVVLLVAASYMMYMTEKYDEKSSTRVQEAGTGPSTRLTAEKFTP